MHEQRIEPVRSVYDNQDQILLAIKHLHCPSGFEADFTYGNGSFYKSGVIDRPRLAFDIQPMCDGVTEADSRNLPLSNDSIDSAVFDPPFMTYVKSGRDHKSGNVVMTSRFGGYWTYLELMSHYVGTITEARRVIRNGGHFVMKCQDIIHNHAMHCTHVKSITAAESVGFRLKDLFILSAKSRMPSPQKGTQRHARIWHSYFLVFQRKHA